MDLYTMWRRSDLERARTSLVAMECTPIRDKLLALCYEARRAMYSSNDGLRWAKHKEEEAKWRALLIEDVLPSVDRLLHLIDLYKTAHE